MRSLAGVQTLLFCVLVLVLAALAMKRAIPFGDADATGWSSGKVSEAFEDHYDEVFPVKRLGINVWAALDYLVFGSGRPGVTVGRDGWLYTDEEFNVDSGAAAQVERNLRLMQWARDELSRRGVPLVIAVVPAKTRVYPEHVGARQPVPLQRDLYERGHRVAQSGAAPTPDLLADLTRGKSQGLTFMRTDTHWSPLGAQLAARAIAEAVRKGGLTNPSPRRYRHVESAPREHRGDLFNFLPMDPYFSALLPPAETVAVVSDEPAQQAGSASAEDLFGDAQIPQVTLIGTSYSAIGTWNFVGALQAALGEEVTSHAQERVGPFVPMVEYLLGSQPQDPAPRLVIWELPERALVVRQELGAFALPAPLAQASAGAAHPKPLARSD